MLEKVRKIGLLMLLMMAMMCVEANVYTPSSLPNPKDRGQGWYVANPDAIIADSDVVFLNRCAAALEAKTRVEMCVAAVQSIGEAECFDFCYELFQRWGIGKKGQNTGVLVFFAMESHDVRIMTGVGLEGVLPDARCSQIIHDRMIPAFRAGDYGGGLCLGVLRIYEVCTESEAPKELRNMQSVTNRGQYAEEEEDVEAWIIIVALVVFIAIIIWASKHKGGGMSSGRTMSSGPIFMGGSSYGGGFSGGSWGGGSTMGGGAGGKW